MLRPARLLALLSTKTAAGIAVGTLALGGAGVAVVVVSHSGGSSSAPANSDAAGGHGREVTSAVSSCKQSRSGSGAAAAIGGSRGIGRCVSEVARQSGRDERAAHAGAATDDAEPDDAP